MTSKTDGYVTLSEAAKMLDISRPTLYKWIREGRLIPFRFMGLPYLPVEAILKLGGRLSEESSERV